MDIHFLTVQIIHVISPLQSLVFNVSQSHVSLTIDINTMSGGCTGKGHDFWVRHCLCA